MQNGPAEHWTQVEWSEDHRTCTATARDGRGCVLMTVTFANGHAVEAIARDRMEQAALEAVRALLTP